MIHPHEDAVTTLYRFFDSEDVLLYVGITRDPRQRFCDHRGAQVWWDEATTIHMERYPTRTEALRAEAEVIKAERPFYNRARGYVPGGQHPKRVVCIRPDLHAKLKEIAKEQNRTISSLAEEILWEYLDEREAKREPKTRKARVA